MKAYFKMSKIRYLFQFMREHKWRFLTLLYIPIYLYFFHMAECITDSNFHYLNTSLDDKIPFIEIFVLPYLAWFGYLTYGIAYTIFKKDGRYYYPLGLNLAIGMTLFIIVSYVWPNAIAIRPTVMPRDNIFTRLVAFLYMTDTPTNVLPSIHVYDSIGMHWGMCQTEFFRTHKRARRNSFILMILILLATLFIKQHSIIDLMAGIALQLVVGIITYGPANGWIFRTARKFDSDVSLSSTPEAKNLSSEA